MYVTVSVLAVEFTTSHSRDQCELFYKTAIVYFRSKESFPMLFSNFVNIYIVYVDVKDIWNNSYIWTAVVVQSEEWSSQ